MAKENEFSFWGDKSVLKLIVVGNAQLCEYTKAIDYTFTWVNCILYELYLKYLKKRIDFLKDIMT